MEIESGRELLLPERITSMLKGPRFRGPVHTHLQVDSTNSIAQRLAREGAPEGTLVVTEEQTAGRGRYKRLWHSVPGGSLCFSILLRPPVDATRGAALTIVGALAVREGVLRTCGVAGGVKWPNDLVVGGRKLAGMLAEMESDAERVKHIVLGVGTNVNMEESDFPPELRPQATSLLMAGGSRVSRLLLLTNVLAELEIRYQEFLKSGLETMVEEWNRSALWMGERVRIVVGGLVRSGVQLGLANSGGLRLQTEEGVEEIVTAGELRKDNRSC